MQPLKKRTLKSLFQRSVEQFANRPALSDIAGKPITYSEMAGKVNDVSTILHNRGIVPGDRVAILSENKPNWGVAYFAITTMGAVVVPILPDFHTNEVQHILRHASCKAVFVSERLYEKLEGGEFESLDTIILIEDFQHIPAENKIDKLKKALSDGSKEFTKLKDAALKLAGKRSLDIQEEDLASIIYTSGTTGHSKGVMLTHKNIVFDALATMKIQDVNENDRFLSILPLSHTYENTIGFIIPIMNGASIYYINKPPTARVLLPAMKKIRPTMILTVPLIIEKIYKTRILPQFSRSPMIKKLYKIPFFRKKLNQVAGKKLMTTFGGEVHFFGIGGASLAPDVEKFLREAHFPYAIGYGLTETAPLIAGTGPALTKFQSTGPGLPDLRVKIDKPDPITGEGEILVQGDNVMKGYYKDPERTAQVITKDGWFRTGDLGKIDKENYLFIKGRLKNLIVGPSGENIYPEEIESIINEFDFVLESVVYQQDKKLVARVHLNYEELDKRFSQKKLSEAKIQQSVLELLHTLRDNVNVRVSSFSRLQKVIEQTEPFEKTPTQKIKRYLYTN